MKNVYGIAADGGTTPFDHIHCANEEAELQNLLEKNLDLIPGDQIDPEDPRRWLLVKREMTVEDPGTAEGRWGLDLLVVDQDGIPTLIECKRFKDSRPRREVIGQMFDYAANASFYLNKDKLTQYFEEQARKRGVDIEALLSDLRPASGNSLEAFLEVIQNNITQGQMRLIFFMEEAPPELRSIVAFLNSQMERTEVCLVEARRIKKTVTVATGKKGRGWDLDTFKTDLKARLDAASARMVISFYDFCLELPGAAVRWGSGPKRGSFNLGFPPAISRAVLTGMSDGELWFPFHSLSNTDTDLAFRDALLDKLCRIPSLGLTEQDRSKWPTLKAGKWLPVKREIEEAIRAAALGLRATNP